jgi:site-specific recombinase XerD
MTAIASHVTAFFQQRLTLERNASVNTCDSYAYAFKMLLDYASKRLRTAPSRLELEQIDAPLVVGFLNHLEATARTVPVPETCGLLQSNRSCASWSTESRRHWSRSTGFSPFQ